jgi:hypothetical protein
MSYGTQLATSLLAQIGAAIAEPMRRTSRPEYQDSIDGQMVIPPGFPTPRPTRFFEIEGFTPYSCGEWGPLWAYKRYKQTFLVWGVQTSKTSIMMMCCLDNFRNDPGLSMWVMPSEDDAAEISQVRFAPLINANFGGSIIENSKLIKRFDSADLLFAWAGSAARLASKPARYMFCDEIGKYSKQTSRETDPFRNAARRVQSYGVFGRIMGGTTPTDSRGIEWEILNEGTNCHRYVLCPHCEHEQIMWFAKDVDRCWFIRPPGDTATLPPYRPDDGWKGGFVWDDRAEMTTDQKAATARYRCEHCEQTWDQADRNRIIHANAGSRWQAWNPGATDYSCHLPSWYSKQVPFAAVVGKYLKAKAKGDDSGEMHDLLNNDCAVPFSPEQQESFEEGFLRRHVLPGLPGGTVPAGAVCVLGAVDFHARHFRLRIRAFAHRSDGSSWGVRCLVMAADYGQLDNYMSNARFPGPDGEMLPVNKWICDGNYDREKVAKLVASDPENRIMAYGKTLSGLNTYKYGMFVVGAGTEAATGIRTVVFDDTHWCGELGRTVRAEPIIGSSGVWWIEDDVPPAYWEEIAKAKSVVRGNAIAWMVPDSAHSWDCEKLLRLLAESGGYLDYEPPAPEPEKKLVEKTNPYTGKKYWTEA